MTTLEPIKPEELAELRAAADRHGCLYPTHLVRKDGEIAGYGSICATPIVNVWLDSHRIIAGDSVRLLARLEAELRARGLPSYIMPCAKDSPFSPHMERLGFRALGANIWHFKPLTKD